jgi:hypothetical protein
LSISSSASGASRLASIRPWLRIVSRTSAQRVAGPATTVMNASRAADRMVGTGARRPPFASARSKMAGAGWSPCKCFDRRFSVPPGNGNSGPCQPSQPVAAALIVPSPVHTISRSMALARSAAASGRSSFGRMKLSATDAPAAAHASINWRWMLSS